MSDLKRIKRKKLNRLGHTHCEDITPALPNKHYNGYLEVTEEKKRPSKKRSGARNGDSTIQVQLELEAAARDRIGCGLWPMPTRHIYVK